MRYDVINLIQGRVDQADVLEREADQTIVEFRQGKLYSYETKLIRGCGVRVIKNGRSGFASSTNPERIDDLINTALELADLGPKAGFRLPPAEEPAVVPTFENKVMLVTVERMVEWGKDLIDALSARLPELKVDIKIHRTYSETSVVNTEGFDGHFAKAELVMLVIGLLVDDGIFWVSDFVNMSSSPVWQMGQILERIESLVRMGKRRATVRTGTYPVVVMPTALPELLFPIAVAVNGKQLEKRTSPLIGKENMSVLSDKITLIDNRLHPYGLASAPFDGEGVRARKNVLFERGFFKGFVFDTATAAVCGRSSTGSAVRDYFSLPQPGLSNLEMLPGDAELGATLKGISEGLLVYDVIGGGQSNYLAGEVSLNVSCGYKIENGVVTGRVKDVGIAGNVYEMFQRVAAVGSMVRDLGSNFLPFVLFSGLKVASRA